MKKILTVFSLLFVANFVFAQNTGVFEYYVTTKHHTNADQTWGNFSSGTGFNDANLGSITASGQTMIIKLAGLKTWKNGGGDVTAANLYYRVYKNDATAPAYTPHNLPWHNNLPNAGDQDWQSNATINLLSTNMAIGTYNVDIYLVASTNQGDRTYGNAGSPMRATFTVDVVLNAELTRFTAVPQANSVLLSWTTASETNNSHFEVERSTDARTWAKVGEVKGNGSKSAESNYTFTDAQPTTGINYYRLKQVDTDGKFAYHKVVSVVMGKGSKVTIAPNPAHEQLQILGATEGGEASIFNVSGQLLMTVKNTTTLNISALPSGVYQLRYQSENGETTLSRFVKQ